MSASVVVTFFTAYPSFAPRGDVLAQQEVTPFSFSTELGTDPPRGFFAYPSQPSDLVETIHNAVHEINRARQLQLKTWEECKVGGKLIIDEICKEIDRSHLFCADLTGMNPNVMFELGYAVSRNKRIWLILDNTRVEARNRFEQLRILTTTGHTGYCNSSDISKAFFHEHPHLDLATTLFEQAIKPTLHSSQRTAGALLYLKARYNTEAETNIARRIRSANMPVTVDDPTESAIQPLAWYGSQTYSSVGVLCHFTAPDRDGAALFNAKNALVAGLALGMEKSLLMLAHATYVTPLDYRDLLAKYRTAHEATKHIEEWITTLEAHWRERTASQHRHSTQMELSTELSGLKFGEPVAENEAEDLLEYFVDTAAYREALEGRSTVFVGRKGAGKTANLIRLASALSKDRRNLVCVIKPVAYEMQGIVDVLKSLKQRDAKGHAIECLWKFLIYSEIANAAAKVIEGRPVESGVDAHEQSLLRFLEQRDHILRADFAVRLERCVDALGLALGGGASRDTGELRAKISETLHQGLLGEVRTALGPILSKQKRVAILIDNLDKAWDAFSDLNELSEVLLGLLSSVRRLPVDMGRISRETKEIEVSLAVFIRSDILRRIQRNAREPDKMQVSRISWRDDELLLRVIEERYLASRGDNAFPAELWERYFCPTVRGMATRLYLVKRILPRPRDLVFMVKAAVTTAVNRGHTRVEESDVLEGEKQYSQQVLESIVVETGDALENIGGVLYEFAGCKAIMSRPEVEAVLAKAGIQSAQSDGAIDQLCSLSFLGIEVKAGDYRFVEEPEEFAKSMVLARKLSQKLGRNWRYVVNP